MGQPLPADPPPRLQPPSSPPHRPPTSSSSSPEPPPPATPSPPTTRTRLPHHQRFNSPTYGLDPEVVALLGRSPRVEPSPTTSPSRFVSPPRVPFDATAADASTAWDRWLDERSSYRRALPLSVPSADLVGSLGRVRDSAERLREAEARMAGGQAVRASGASTSRLPDSLTNFADSLEEPRRALEQVRQRLDETRQRVAAVAARTRSREVELDEAAERARAQARDSLDRTVDFASRLDQLANTLNSIAQRASALSPALEPLRQPARPANLVNSAGELEPPSIAAQTDSIRDTVRQLMLASRRVSSAVDRHRELAVGSSTSAAPSPALDEPLRVIVLSPSSSSDPLVDRPDTSPNPAGLLLPTSTLFTTSPASLSPSTSPRAASPRTTTSFPPPPSAPERENYPGERAQLLRIAALQADIAARAGELRTLRERGREVDRERRAPEGGSGGPSAGALEDKDEEDGVELRGAPLARAERTPLLLAGRTGRLLAEQHDEGAGVGGRKRARTAAELEREYQLFRFCGR
ncbi:hypothetical protein JCM8208_006901 [Rhodotorula glutinis]